MFNVDIGEINPLASCCTDRLMELHNSNAIIGRKQELAHFKVVSYAPFGYAKWQRWSIVSHGEPRAIISYDDDDDKTWLLHVYRVERVQHERKRTWWGPCVFLSRHSVKAPKWSLSLSLSCSSFSSTDAGEERKKETFRRQNPFCCSATGIPFPFCIFSFSASFCLVYRVWYSFLSGLGLGFGKFKI